MDRHESESRLDATASLIVQQDRGEGFERVYATLRSIAEARLRATPNDRTMHATDLVHEAYVRISSLDEERVNDTEHLKAIAAQSMRWILVDRARSRLASKRGGDRTRESRRVDDQGESDSSAEDLIALDEALRRLEAHDPRLVRLVELRYFAGSTIDETAAVLAVSPVTVKRWWQVARARLLLDMKPEFREEAR